MIPDRGGSGAKFWLPKTIDMQHGMWDKSRNRGKGRAESEGGCRPGVRAIFGWREAKAKSARWTGGRGSISRMTTRTRGQSSLRDEPQEQKEGSE